LVTCYGRVSASLENIIEKNLKILYLILDGFPTFRPDVASLWGKYLARLGVLCDISTIRLQVDIDGSKWESGACHLYTPPVNKVWEQLGAFLHDCKVLWCAGPRQYEAIQVRDKSFICLVALPIAHWRGIPFFYWMSFPMAESLARLASQIDWRKNFPRWLFLTVRGRLGGYVLRQWVLPRCDHIFVQSNRMLADVAASGIQRTKITAVPMCVDPERFPAPLPCVNTPTGNKRARRVIGYLGECSRVRRIDFLFESVALIKLEMPDIELLIVGDANQDNDRAWLQARIDQLGLRDNVRMTGWVSAERAVQEFATAEVALALMAPDPLLDSTTPTKLVEYLAMGRAVVANDHPDQSFVIEQSKGGLCTPFDPRAYADAVLTLLNDPQAASAMAVNGRDWVLTYRSYDQAAIQLKNIYEQLVVPSSIGVAKSSTS
jgi:glycosyltransferase involved in cell wall biosynthesis